MQPDLIVKLPVAELDRSIAFYEALGAHDDGTLLDRNAVCLALGEAARVMLLTHERWRELFHTPVGNAHRSAQAILSLPLDTRAGVDERIAAAVAAGGRADPASARSLPLMYARTVADPDGHIWEIVWMNPEHEEMTELQTAIDA